MKKPGDQVKRGEIIAEVDTDKGVIEVEVFTGGIIEQLLIEPGAEVPVGTVLAIIREEEKAVGSEISDVITPRFRPRSLLLHCQFLPLRRLLVYEHRLRRKSLRANPVLNSPR